MAVERMRDLIPSLVSPWAASRPASAATWGLDMLVPL